MIALILALSPVVAVPFDEPSDTVVPSREAARHVGERCTVELVVRATKDETKGKVYYLDSEADYRDPANFAVVIDYADLPAFRAAGVADPIAHYKGKTIRVTGTIARDKTNGDGLEIRARDPVSIRVVEGP
jgi:hypothetical protein